MAQWLVSLPFKQEDRALDTHSRGKYSAGVAAASVSEGKGGDPNNKLTKEIF